MSRNGRGESLLPYKAFNTKNEKELRIEIISQKACHIFLPYSNESLKKVKREKYYILKLHNTSHFLILLISSLV